MRYSTLYRCTTKKRMASIKVRGAKGVMKAQTKKRAKEVHRYDIATCRVYTRHLSSISISHDFIQFPSRKTGSSEKENP